MFKVRCANCGQKIEDSEDLTGKACPVCGTVIGESGAQNALKPGTRIGGYEIVRMIGSGGTGNVYVAIQISMGRQAAVKVLYPELTKDEESVRQFFSEVKTLGSIQHPNIVCAFDSGMDNGLYFMAMQYIPGLPLDEVVAKDGPLAVAKALRITESIAEALNYVWTKYRLCHRDIKPGNIMLNEDDVPMLLDFGAVLRSGENSISHGLIEGSPCFMSPEQARGEKLTFASDLYSLGASLYLLLTGVTPYDDPDVRVILDQQCNSPFPLPSQRVPGINIPEEVVSLLSRMMAKKPEDRFESWESFLREMKKVRKSLQTAKSTGGKTAKSSAVKPHAGAAARTAHTPAGQKKKSAFSVPQEKPKKKLSVIPIFCYILITLLTACAVAFMIGRSNTESARNRLQEAEAAMRNVREHDKNPERAQELYRRAKAMARKFGVSAQAANEINEACDEALGELDVLIKENKQTEKLHTETMILLKESGAAMGAMQKKPSKENAEAIKKIQEKLKKISETMLAAEYMNPNNAEKMEEDVLLIRKQTEFMTDTMKAIEKAEKRRAARKKAVSPPAREKAGSAKGKAPSGQDTEDLDLFLSEPVAPAAKASAAPAAKEPSAEPVPEVAAESKSAPLTEEEKEAQKKKKAENQKERRKERYRKAIEKEKTLIARDVIVECRNCNFDKVEQLLVVSSGMKAPEPEWEDMERNFTAWLVNIRRIYEDAKGVLGKISADEPNKKDRVYRLAGGNKRLLCHSLMLLGYFAEANKIVAEKDKAILAELAKAYLEPRIERAMRNARKGNDRELHDLRKDYKGFNLYTELENTVRSRITGGK